MCKMGMGCEMSVFLIGIIALINFFIAVCNVRDTDYPHAIMWTAYGVANIGLIWYELTKGN